MSDVERFSSLHELALRESRTRREEEERNGVCPSCHGDGSFRAAPPHYVTGDPFGGYRPGGYWIACPRCFGTGSIADRE